jgi:hypothetical protein
MAGIGKSNEYSFTSNERSSRITSIKISIFIFPRKGIIPILIASAQFMMNDCLVNAICGPGYGYKGIYKDSITAYGSPFFLICRRLAYKKY